MEMGGCVETHFLMVLYKLSCQERSAKQYSKMTIAQSLLDILVHDECTTTNNVIFTDLTCLQVSSAACRNVDLATGISLLKNINGRCSYYHRVGF